MRRTGRPLLGLLALVAACAPAPSAPEPDAAAVGALARSPAAPARISVDVQDLDLAEVCEQIGRQAGRNILVDPDVEERVTVSLRDIAWREAVDVLAHLARVEVAERPGGILVLARRSRIDVRARDLPARAYFQLLASVAGKNVIVSPAVHGPPVTVRLDDGEWRTVLLAHARALDAQVVNDSDDLLRVVPWPDEDRAPGPPEPVTTIVGGPFVELEAAASLGERLLLGDRGTPGETLLGWSPEERDAVALLGRLPAPCGVALAHLEDGRLAGVVVQR